MDSPTYRKAFDVLIVDGHLDLAMNALGLDRDLTRSVFDIRKQEIGMPERGRAMGTVALPEMRAGEVGVCLATMIARKASGGTWTVLNSSEASYATSQGQLAYYRILEQEGLIRIIKDQGTLDGHVEEWQQQSGGDKPLGFVLAMEGADGITNPKQLQLWWDVGLRVVSLTHFGVDVHGHGTGTKGGITDKGLELLRKMESVGMILDVTHLSEQSFWEALDSFSGSVVASHNNCRALVPGDRQFSDEQIKALAARDAVIGVALDAWMLYPGWVKGQTPNTVVSLEAVADQMNHIAKVAGNTRNVGIGSDLDGGHGKEQTPHDLETIADLQKIPQLLKKRGYTEEDIKSIMHGNWLRILRKAWA